MSWTPSRWHLPAASIAAGLVVFATVFWSSRSVPPAPAASTSVATRSQPAMDQERRGQRQAAQANSAAALVSMPAPTVDSEESTVVQYLSEKYQFLLDDLHDPKPGQQEQLQRALLARERIAGQARTVEQDAALARVEDQIRGMLHPADYATYEMLKDSDLELYKLNEYAGGIANVAPLSTADRKAILKTKLAYKERFRQLVLNSDLQRTGLSAAEREYAYSTTSRALEDYKRSYLQEVRQYLASDEQYVLLSNYETTEFNAELSRLKSMVDDSSRGGS